MTAAELAAWIGVTPSAIRQVARRHSIQPTCTSHHGAKVYNPHDVLRHAGWHDRRDHVSH